MSVQFGELHPILTRELPEPALVSTFQQAIAANANRWSTLMTGAVQRQGVDCAAAWNPFGSCMPRISPSSLITQAGISLGALRCCSNSPDLSSSWSASATALTCRASSTLFPRTRFDQRRIDLRQYVTASLSERLERPNLRATTVAQLLQRGDPGQRLPAD